MNHGKTMSIHDRLLPSGRQQNDHMYAYKFVDSLKVCAKDKNLCRGSRLHADILKHGLLGSSPYVATALINMYAKCGMIEKAKQVLEDIPNRDIVAWCALISGYTKQDRGYEALNCFERMQSEGLFPSVITFTCILKACGSVRAIDKGRQIHYEIIRRDMLEKDVMLGNGLVDMYARCGALAAAQQVLEELPIRNVVTWSTLIAGYAEHEHYDQALSCLEQMQMERVSPNEITFTSILKSVANIGFTAKGQEIHSQLVKKGYLESDLIVGNTLVDMYARCGSLHIAHEVLQRIQSRQVVTWNALLSGYAQLGECENVFNIFDRMVGESIKPNGITFISVLKACSRTSLFFRGLTYFGNMSKDYGVLPTLEHNNCIIHLLNCAGELGKAVEMIYQFRCSDMMVWHSMLYACKNWGNVKLGRLAFEQAIQLDSNNLASYVLMVNIYVAAGMKEDAKRIEAMREQCCFPESRTWI